MKRKALILTVLLVFTFINTSISVGAEMEVPVWNPTSNQVQNNDNKINKTTNENSAETTTNIVEENGTVASSIHTENEAKSNEITSKSNIIATNTKNQNSQESLHTIPSTVTNNSLNLTSGGAILIEENSGNILYNHNMHEKLRPASVTKVMTLLIIMEALDKGEIALNDKVPCTEDAAKMGGSQIWLDTTEELTVDEMIKAICVVSANDCTVAMANYLSGSQEAFVEKMNQKAKDLGMNDTTFKNCHGIDEDGHITSAYDIAVMSRELLKNHPHIKNYTTIYMDSLRDGKSQLVNTNKLVRNYEGCTGLKTGSTSLALFNLSASATRNGLSLIAVVMKGENSKIRFSEASKLLNYGFGNYEYKEVAHKGDVVGECIVNKGLKNKVGACYENDFGFVTKKNDKQEIEQNVEIYNNVFAPITAGQKVGEITYTINNEKIGSVNLISNETIEKYGFTSMLLSVYKKWFCLLRL